MTPSVALIGPLDVRPRPASATGASGSDQSSVSVPLCRALLLSDPSLSRPPKSDPKPLNSFFSRVYAMSHRLLPRRTTSLLRAARLSPTTPRLTALLPRQSIPCQQQSRSISQSAVRWALMPHAENPPPKESEPLVEQHSTASEPTPLEEEAYHPLADGYLDRVVARMEEVAEGREDVDVEYSVSTSRS